MKEKSQRKPNLVKPKEKRKKVYKTLDLDKLNDNSENSSNGESEKLHAKNFAFKK